MIATATLAGQPLMSHNLDIVSRLWQTEIRVEATGFQGAAVGDELVLTLDGEQAVVAAVRSVAQRVGHEYLVAEPRVTQELRGYVSREVGPLVLDGERTLAIATQLLDPVTVTVQSALDIALGRWSTRERSVAWAWRSLLRGVAISTEMNAEWRHDARGDAVRGEADTSDWPERPMPTALVQIGDGWAEFEAAPVQAGDMIGGSGVIYSRTYLSRDMHRSRVRTVPL